MAYINIFIGNSARISIENSQLKLSGEKAMTYPLEDINSVMVESNLCNITSATLSRLAEFNVLVYFCNEFHLPNSLLLPLNNHFKPLGVFNQQIAMPKPKLKNIWKSIISDKIKNQNKVCIISGKKGVLEDYEDKLLSGDSSNMEAAAASVYFKELFGTQFNRSQDNFINACLNYGYTILRGAMARSVVAHGLTSYIGIFHHNTLNAFNLADDLMEPFRPIVDLYVMQVLKLKNEDEVLNTKIKIELYNLLNNNIKFNNSKYCLSYAMDCYVSSFISCLSSKNCANFPKIEILSLEMHEYE